MWNTVSQRAEVSLTKFNFNYIYNYNNYCYIYNYNNYNYVYIYQVTLQTLIGFSQFYIYIYVEL